MRVGCLKEIKSGEYRVGLTPANARELIAAGHEVWIEKSAGEQVGFDDALYEQCGAKIIPHADEIFKQAALIVKVKEPQPDECHKLRPDQVLFTYLHLAADLNQTKLLQASHCVAIGYETVTNRQHGLPLLAPMSEVAGRLAIQAGARCLEIHYGGRGILLGGIPGVAPAKVLVIGGGVVGINAVRVAIGMGAQVIVLDKSLERLYDLDLRFGARIHTVLSTTDAIEKHIHDADLVIGAVLIPGASAPKLVTKAMLHNMRPGVVLVDVAIDQGGCFETSRPTTHDKPTYIVNDVVHYCVTNMPSAAARTATIALSNATFPYVLSLANLGYKKALKHSRYFLKGLNVYQGHITHPAVAKALNLPYTDPRTLLVD